MIWSWYLIFGLSIVALLIVDLKLVHQHSQSLSWKPATLMSLQWAGLAAAFGVLLFYLLGWHFSSAGLFDSLAAANLARNQLILEFIACYLIELMLSIDNVFVFLAIFHFLAIPPQRQHRVLFWGILGAFILRALFMAIGSQLIEYPAVNIALGLFLIMIGIKMAYIKEKNTSLKNNSLFKFLKGFLPVTDTLKEGQFLIKYNKKWQASPLLLALLMVESMDLVFALDSVPAVFAMTKEPFIAFTSNILAVLGLRALYFLLSAFLKQCCYLKYGLGAVLVFVGLKMSWLNSLYQDHFPISLSLSIIIGILILSIVASLWVTKKGLKKTRRP